MDQEREKIEQIKSLDASGADVSSQSGLCRYAPGEDAKVRRAKEEKVAESLQARQGHGDIDGFVPTEAVHDDGEYIATKREGSLELHCIVWRELGQWRRLSGWSEQMPSSATPHREILFAPEPTLRSVD